MILELAILFVLLVLSGIFSGLETAYVSITHIQIEKLKKKHRKKAAKVDALKEESHKLLTTILIGNNLVNVSASALSTILTLQLIGSSAVAYTAGILTLLILIFGEVTPKRLAIDHNEFICLNSAFLLKYLMIFLTPIIFVIDIISDLIIGIFSSNKKNKPKVTEEDIKNAVGIGERIGQLEPQEKRMIINVFKFNDTQVKDIMTHRNDVFSVSANKNISELKKIIGKVGYSRIPVYEDTKDNIKGILLLKHAIKFFNGKKSVKIKKIMKSPLFVHESLKIDDMLLDFKTKKTHIACVLDEKGGFLGIVTIEDVIEEIVGEIYDEKDIVQKKIKRLNKNTYIIKADALITTVNKRFGIKLSYEDDFEILSSYILRKSGKIPEQGYQIKIKKGRFVVENVRNNRIETIKFIKK